jgi:hypothetical protein
MSQDNVSTSTIDTNAAAAAVKTLTSVLGVKEKAEASLAKAEAKEQDALQSLYEAIGTRRFMFGDREVQVRKAPKGGYYLNGNQEREVLTF